MKRTAEITLGIIGIVINGFFALIGGLMVWMKNNEETVREMLEETEQDTPGGALTTEDLNEAFAHMGETGWMIFGMALGAIVLGIIALILLRGNKQPKISGGILIVTAVASVFMLGILALISGIFYIISGFMCLLRKPSETIQDPPSDTDDSGSLS